MAGSDAAVANPSDSKTKRPRLRIAAVLASVLGMALVTTEAQAQYMPPPWAYPYYRGDYPPPPGPPGDEGPMAGPPGYYQPRVTVADIRRRVGRLGLHLIAKPRRKNNIYLAAAQDPSGVEYRLVFDAASGRLIENTKLPPRKKKIAAEKLPAEDTGNRQ